MVRRSCAVVLTCSTDANLIKERLLLAQYTWHEFRDACVSPLGVRTEWHYDGEGVLHIPDLVDIKVVTIEGLPVAGLTSLIVIELKLLCVLHPLKEAPDPKHRKDVITLIRLRNLDEQYADKLASPVRDLFMSICRSCTEQD